MLYPVRGIYRSDTSQFWDHHGCYKADISTKLKLAKTNPVIQTVVSSIKWIIECTEGQIVT